MYVEESGSGPAVLLLHGGGVSGWMWRPVLAALAGRVRGIVPDLPGHGRSSIEPFAGHDATADALAELLAERAPGGAIVAGFSLGAQLALRLAADRPSLVARVVAISAQTLPLPFERSTLAALAAAAPLARREWFARLQAAEVGVPADLVPEYVRASAALSRETLLGSVAANLRFRLPAGWGRYPGPAVVLVGGRERPVMQDSARATQDALPGSVLVRVRGAGHDLPFTRPDLVARAILGGFSGEGQP